MLLAALSHHGRPAHKPTCSGGGPPEIWKPFANYDPCAVAALLRSGAGRGSRMRSRRVRLYPIRRRCASVLPESSRSQIRSGRMKSSSNSSPTPIKTISTVLARSRQKAVEKWASGGPIGLNTPWLPTCERLFGYEKPRPLQSAVTETPLDWPLLILESETGSGKTEAAILRFAALWRAKLVDGLYFAVPTRAAAKQLHDRVRKAFGAASFRPTHRSRPSSPFRATSSPEVVKGSVSAGSRCAGRTSLTRRRASHDGPRRAPGSF